MKYDIEKLIQKVNDVNGIIPISNKYQNRGGDGIIGHAFEEFLEIEENNSVYSDTEEFEIKTKKDTSSSKYTLFNRGKRGAHWTINKYYFNQNFGTGYVDVNFNKNIHGLKLYIEEPEILMKDKDDTILYRINIYNDLYKRLINKLKNTLVVTVNKVKPTYFKILKLEYFNNISIENFLNEIRQGNLYICSNVGSGGHDRGTQFRIKKNRMFSLFEEKKVWKIT